MKAFSRIYLVLIFLLLYAPILVLIVFSFNEKGSFAAYTGFSFKWYRELFRDSTALQSLRNSLLLAISSAAIATVIGMFAALGLDRMRLRWLKNSIKAVTNIPMMNPDIVTGVSMLLFFVAVGGILQKINGNIDLIGFPSMLIAHVTFSLPYVILSILPRFRQLDPSLREAAMDLGCTPAQSFFKVEFPHILPGIVTGMIMAFTLSLDDFVISHFVSSPDFVTLPLYIYNQTAHRVKYSMYALCTLIIFVMVIMLLLVNFVSGIGERGKRKKETV
ncbi:MAG: ABC transporter permease [Ruminococcaceae bacterium]|nr:ABC transporter permease [Oscillospiraceae bacterium]